MGLGRVSSPFWVILAMPNYSFFFWLSFQPKLKNLRMKLLRSLVRRVSLLLRQQNTNRHSLGSWFRPELIKLNEKDQLVNRKHFAMHPMADADTAWRDLDIARAWLELIYETEGKCHTQQGNFWGSFRDKIVILTHLNCNVISCRKGGMGIHWEN